MAVRFEAKNFGDVAVGEAFYLSNTPHDGCFIKVDPQWGLHAKHWTDMSITMSAEQLVWVLGVTKRKSVKRAKKAPKKAAKRRATKR